MKYTEELLVKIRQGDFRSLGRAISLVENEAEGSEELLLSLRNEWAIPLIGITGPPGAGKSTLVNGLITEMTAQGKKVGVIAIDPTSPFNYGSLLGDRIRMAEHFNNDNVFIRSLATRGSLGGLSSKAIEITDVMKAANFDYILLETVGVGQSEVEVVGLADMTIVVLVPEAGDEVQGIKSGLMEIADLFVVNKADRPGADEFAANLKKMLHQYSHPRRGAGPRTVSIVKTVADKCSGIAELLENIKHHTPSSEREKRLFLLAEKAFKLIQAKRMIDIGKNRLLRDIGKLLENSDFSLYRYVDAVTKEKNRS